MSTSEAVAFHAAERPDAVAFIDGSRTISYAQFSRDIGKFSAALRALGLPRGSTVAVSCEDVYIHWLLLVAFEHLSVATASFDSTEGPGVLGELLADVDLVLCDQKSAHAGRARQVEISRAWVQNALARADEEREIRAQLLPDDVVRILRSSGTTGRPKRLAISRRMYELRAARYGERYQFSKTSRYLLALSFALGHSYGCATACLRAGGSVVRKSFTLRDIDIFRAYGITHVSLLPYFLKEILDGLPADFTKPTNLTIGTSGSLLSDELSGRALRLLATEVLDFFGCNEVGGISYRRASHRDGFATVCPGVEVEVIDGSGQPTPSGEPGRLRIRSGSMAEGYVNDPETTRRFFKDGWFYPSDVAILDGPRRIKIVGRADEVIFTPIGKFATSDVEAFIAHRIGVGDVGVCTLPNPDGIEEIYVGIAGARLGLNELLVRVTDAFSTMPIGRFHVWILKTIPRNAAGKIQRATLKELIATAVRRG